MYTNKRLTITEAKKLAESAIAVDVTEYPEYQEIISVILLAISRRHGTATWSKPANLNVNVMNDIIAALKSDGFSVTAISNTYGAVYDVNNRQFDHLVVRGW